MSRLGVILCDGPEKKKRSPPIWWIHLDSSSSSSSRVENNIVPIQISCSVFDSIRRLNSDGVVGAAPLFTPPTSSGCRGRGSDWIVIWPIQKRVWINSIFVVWLTEHNKTHSPVQCYTPPIRRRDDRWNVFIDKTVLLFSHGWWAYNSMEMVITV